MADGLIAGARISVSEAQAALTAMDKRVDLATASAVVKVAALARTSVRSRMRGRPRWDRRGNGRSGPGINLNLSPHVVTKSGGPGKLTGSLYGAVKKSRKARPEIGGFSAVAFVGTGGNPGVNIYKGITEAEHAFFKPGVDKATPKMPAVWEAAWAKATKTK